MRIDLQAKTASERWYEWILNKPGGSFLHRIMFVFAALMFALGILDSMRRESVSPTAFAYSFFFVAIGINCLERTIAKRAFERILGEVNNGEQADADQPTAAVNLKSE